MKNLVIVALLGLVLVGTSSVFVIQESHVGVLFQFGRVVRTDIPPGLHFKLPFVQDAMAFDRRILTLDSQPERYLTSEKKDVNVDFFVKWRIKDVLRYYQGTSGIETSALQRMDPIVKEAIRNEITKRTLKEVVAGERANLAERFIEVTNQATQSLGIEVVDVRIKRIDLPEDSTVLGSVFDRMRAERKRVANELRAEGTEASETIRSDADRNRAVIVAEAERDAQRLRGEGDAQAAATYAAAYGRDAEFYAFHRSLESYRQAFSDGKSVMVLDPSSEFFHYFEDIGRTK
jgi:membrane protease subunit HflC